MFNFPICYFSWNFVSSFKTGVKRQLSILGDLKLNVISKKTWKTYWIMPVPNRKGASNQIIGEAARKNSQICLTSKTMTPAQGNPIFFRSSQQLLHQGLFGLTWHSKGPWLVSQVTSGTTENRGHRSVALGQVKVPSRHQEQMTPTLPTCVEIENVLAFIVPKKLGGPWGLGPPVLPPTNRNKQARNWNHFDD